MDEAWELHLADNNTAIVDRYVWLNINVNGADSRIKAYVAGASELLDGREEQTDSNRQEDVLMEDRADEIRTVVTLRIRGSDPFGEHEPLSFAGTDQILD